MAGFEKDQQVWVPDPNGKGTLAAVFLGPAELGETPEFAWVRYREGSREGWNEEVPYEEIAHEPRKPNKRASDLFKRRAG